MRILNAVLLSVFLLPMPSNAEQMTVDQMKLMLDEKGKLGELGATSYVHGVVDGLIAMESMRRNGSIRPKEFCRVFDAGAPAEHPAFRTREIVMAWQKAGKPMSTSAVDVVLSFMSGEYGCR